MMEEQQPPEQSPEIEPMEIASAEIDITTTEQPENIQVNTSDEKCDNCGRLEKEVRLVTNQLKTLRSHLDKRRREVKMLRRKGILYIILAMKTVQFNNVNDNHTVS